MKKSQIKLLDSLWSQAVKDRAGWKCEYCQSVLLLLGLQIFLCLFGEITMNLKNVLLFISFALVAWIIISVVVVCWKNYQRNRAMQSVLREFPDTDNMVMYDVRTEIWRW